MKMTSISSRGWALAALLWAGFMAVQSADAGPRVAIVASAEVATDDPRFTDVQEKLASTGRFEEVAIINAFSYTPTLEELEEFDALLVWSNRNFANATLLGDTLALYVDRGGGVVLSIFANTTSTSDRFLAGRWLDEEYDILPVGGGTLSSGGQRELGTIRVPDHPIMDGVHRFRGGAASFRPLDLGLTSHGQIIAQWTDESTLVGTSSRFRHRADLGMYPPSNAVLSTLWDPNTDGARLMANALIYTARCRADVNHDDRVDFFDYLDFVSEFENGDESADFNRDGTVDFFDYLDFLPAFEEGCD
jgi:hypothetical protein